MADFAFAIVVPLASPIQTVATSKDDTELASRPLISSELGASKISTWYPPRPASIAHRALCHALIWRVLQAIIVAIDQYAEAALGNREYFLNKPYSIRC